MTLFKRAIKSIIRRPVKTVVLLLIIILLGSVTSGAISIQTAINNTIHNLRRNMPPVVMVVPNWSAIHTWHEEPDGSGWLEEEDVDPERLTITAQHLRDLSTLPQVRDFEFAVITRLTNTDLIDQQFSIGATAVGGADWVYSAHGTASPDIFYFTEGVLEIVAGRLPTVEELGGSENVNPIVIPLTVAEVNDLNVGDTLEMFATVSSLIPMDDFYILGRESYTEEHAFARKGYEFEIVGIFDMVDREANAGTVHNLELQRQLLQTMFLSADIAEEVDRFIYDQAVLQIEAGLFSNTGVDPNQEFVRFEKNTFILHDPLYVEDFREEASLILPDLVIVEDLSNNFASMEVTMDTLQELVDHALIFSLVATILILCLLITLFLHDRRNEIGIYLALGEKRAKIMLQILSEVVLTAFIGIIIALFIGNIISQEISHELVRTELAQNTSTVNFMDWRGFDSVLSGRGFGNLMTSEEMLEAFDTTLTTRTTALFIGIAISTTVIATGISLTYILKMNPKKILVQGKIE